MNIIRMNKPVHRTAAGIERGNEAIATRIRRAGMRVAMIFAGDSFFVARRRHAAN